MIHSAKELILLKASGKELSQQQLSDFFEGFIADEVTDYQASAMLTAIFCRGMSLDETVTMTELMRDSGHRFQWEKDSRPVLDKHSTGGVGDKTSLVILPLCIVNGLRVPMICGRGLGHTGGTIDKLLSIPGMRVDLNPTEMQKQVTEIGGAFVEQTPTITPLDGKLYALRDSVGTVASTPLMVSSILSKKLAEGLDALLIDVKTGNGAFMQQEEESLILAKMLQTVGERCGLKVRCMISSMDSPLGKTAGNALEVLECVDIMKGKGPMDTQDLVLELTTEMLHLAFPERRTSDIRSKLMADLASGQALDAFKRVITAQGGDCRFVDDPSAMGSARYHTTIEAECSGYLEKIDVQQLGYGIISLGGGRTHKDQQIDTTVGLSGLQRQGCWFDAGEALCTIHANSQEANQTALRQIKQAFIVGEKHRVDTLIRTTM